jgi:putative nucleotidyltransferase with HDIG domain
MKFLSKLEAEDLLKLGETTFPGPWMDHSIVTAECAYKIAAYIPELDADVAYILGLLHDIGRTQRISSFRHIVDGYNMMIEEYPLIAKICLTHSFPIKEIEIFTGEIDVEKDVYLFVKKYLDNVTYDDYDLLIQLCDAVALPTGACIIEKRLIDVAIRRGINPNTSVRKWKKFLELKKYFDKKINRNIYEVIDIIL